MDNNFNQQQMPQQAPQQMPQQAPQQMPQMQQMPQQQVPQQPMYQQAPKQPSKTNTKELLALILAGVGTFFAFIGSILTCSCSASKTKSGLGLFSGSIHSTSAVMILAIFGVILAAVGVVFAVLALKEKDAPVKAGKMAYIALAVGAFGIMYGVLSTFTICGYNCSLNSSYSDALSSSFGSLF